MGANGMLGTRLSNRYRLDTEVGHGGMGTVYRAHDTLLNRDVAVKLVSASVLGTEGRARLLQEAQAVAQLNHPNVVTIHDVGEDNGSPFIVMEWLAGRSVYDAILTSGAGAEAPDFLERVGQILSIAQQVCAALEHAHRHGIVHHDLKPENVLLAAIPAPRTTPTVKLVDFGLARPVSSQLEREGALEGTVLYLAPEQALGQPVDPRSDLYALGVMLYELLCGQLPFQADDPLVVISQHLHAPVLPPRAIRPEIPPPLDALILRLLSKRLEDRPASAAVVRQALEELNRGPSAQPYAELAPLEHLARGRLVGREAELAEARAVWHSASTASGQQRLLLVTGEAGTGKTPLVREVRTLAEVTGGRAIVSACYTEGTAPYAPVAQFIREGLLVPHPDVPGPSLPDLVLAGLIDLAPELQIHYPHVPALVPLDPHADRQRLFECVVALCAALAEGGPLLWVMEDAQWADSGTLFLLRHLAQRSRSMGLRLLLLLTYREAELGEACCLADVLQDLDRHGLVARIKMPRLDREQTGKLLGVLLQGDVPEAFLDAIYLETDGNPLFVEEICNALVENGHLRRVEGHWQWTGLQGLRLPQSINLAIQSRVSRLPPHAQEVLRLAAVIGRQFDFETLCRSGDLEEEALIRALEAAVRAQLLVEVEPSRGDGSRELLAFAHKATMTALLESLSGLRRRRLHRRVAAAIEALRPDDLEALAYHHAQAGDEERALTYHLRAAVRAQRVYANEDAVRLYSEALLLLSDDDPDRFDVLAARAQVYGIIARREEQLADVEAMLALAGRLDDDTRQCDALLAVADYYLETEPPGAGEPARRARLLAEQLGDAVRQAEALVRLGREARYRYDYQASRSALESAIARFQEADRPADVAGCLHMLSLTLGEMGEAEAARMAAVDALAASRAAADLRQEAISLRRLAIVHLNAREHATALPFAEEALALHRKLGDRTEEWRALSVLGVLSGWLGRPEETRDYLQQALDLAIAIDSSVGVRSAAINMLWAYYARQGDYEAALAFLKDRVGAARREGDDFLAVHLGSQEPFFLAALGQHGPALEAVERLLESSENLLGAGNHSRYLAFAGQMEAELGNHDRASAYLEAALAQAEPGGTATDVAVVLRTQAYASFLDGKPASVRAGLESATRAVDLLRGTTPVDELAEALHKAALLHLALSEADTPAQASAAHIEAALACTAETLRLTATWPVAVALEAYLYTHACALRAAGREAEAEDPLRRAYDRVRSIAAKTRDEALRQSWLSNVRVNRQIVEAWEAWGLGPKPGKSREVLPPPQRDTAERQR